MNNIAGISVATSANNNNQNNNIETLKGMITAGHDGAKDFGSGEYGLTFGFNWGEYNIFVSRTYGMWLVSLYKNYKSEWTSEGRKISYDAQILDRRLGNYARGKRWSMSLAENMAEFILDTIADYESQSDWDEFVDMCDRKDDIVSSYQTEIDGYVQDIIAIADKMENIENKVDAFAIKQIVYKIMHTEQDCYDTVMGEACSCFGTEIDLMALWNWYNNYGQHYTDNNFSREDLDLGELIDTLEYMTTIEYDMPFATEEDKEYIDEDDPDNIDWLMGHNLPYYVAYEVGQYASTYYHYAYCA